MQLSKEDLESRRSTFLSEWGRRKLWPKELDQLIAKGRVSPAAIAYAER